MPGVQQVLEGLLDTMAASALPKPGGQAFVTDVLPRPGQVDVAEVVQGAVDLTWVTKDVRFATDDLETALDKATLDPKILGGMPIAGTLLTGVPGLVGQLAGSLPLLHETRVPVALSVTWRVLDGRGQELPGSEWRAPGGLSGPEVTVAFAPEVVELTSSVVPPAPTLRYLRAHVALTAGGVTVERDLPDVPVPVAPLPVPRVLGCFRHTGFSPRSGDDDGFAFVMVPTSSPVKSLAQLNGTLSQLQTAVGSLVDFGRFATFLLGLSDLVNAVAAQPYFALAAADGIEDLNDITVIQNSWYENDIELEDEISSMVLVGPPDTGVEVWCETGFDDENGLGTLRVPDTCAVVVRSLHADVPTTQPPDRWTTQKTPDHTFTDPDGFGDWSSGLRFV